MIYPAAGERGEKGGGVRGIRTLDSLERMIAPEAAGDGRERHDADALCAFLGMIPELLYERKYKVLP
jgi:hypothetical protein